MQLGKPLRMKMDVRDSEEDRERELLLLYKQQQEWACPLHCTLVGDVAIGEGVMRYFMTTIISKLQFGFSLDLALNMKILHRNRRTQFQIFPCLGIFRQSPKQIGDGYITNFYSMQSLGGPCAKLNS
ncbi:hypothetical protein J4Q44_G00391740 [Coregonus suidteri]|uniref:Uncharacterized protein n=1 Tax=Coregonus suidteri TaxID=861788 RepID=A0AAN8KIW0_9TELE